MSEEFTKSAPGTVVSTEGFSVEVKPTISVIYRDAAGEVSIGSEWLVKPPAIAIHKGARTNKGLEGKAPAQIDELFDRVVRALQFMKHRVELNEDGAQPRTFEPAQ